MKIIITESQFKLIQENVEKNMFFRYWDKQKNSGVEPTMINNFTKAQDKKVYDRDLGIYWIEYNGGIETVKNKTIEFLNNKVFDINDYSDTFSIGSYDFKFKVITDNIEVDNFNNADVNINVFDFSFDDPETGEIITDIYNTDYAYENLYEITDICNLILDKVLLPKFGIFFMVNKINFI